MRRRQLKWLWARLKQLSMMTLSREELLMKLGAARAHAPAAWRLVVIAVAPEGVTRLWTPHRRCPHGAGLGLFAKRRHVGRGRSRRRLSGPMGTAVAAGGVPPARRPSARELCAWINPGGAPRNAPLCGTWRVADLYQRSGARDRRSLDDRTGDCGEA